MSNIRSEICYVLDSPAPPELSRSQHNGRICGVYGQHIAYICMNTRRILLLLLWLRWMVTMPPQQSNGIDCIRVTNRTHDQDADEDPTINGDHVFHKT